MIDVASLAIVSATGLFFVALGGASLLAPAAAGRFLLGFADSSARHYAELAVRFLVGGAFLLASSGLPAADAFRLFGWGLLATTAGLLLVPWHWHRRFARHAVPRALRFLPLVGLASVVFGGLVVRAVLCRHAL